MSQTAEATTTYETVGTGLNVYESVEVVEGVVKWLDTPEDVISFTAAGADVSDVVVISRGGTTTFLTMALNAGVRGVVTLQGAPESHLGILCREYGIPCIMSVSFDQGVRTDRGEIVPADGVRVRLDVSSRPDGTVAAEPGAPVDDSPSSSDAPSMSEEEKAQIQLLLTKFGGEIPGGVEGDAIMRAEMATRVLYADGDSMHRDLTVHEVNEAVRYYTWNEWNALASRATEGESGLIPRQEYEAMGIMNCWFKHPEWLRAIEDRVGIDGIIEIGSLGRREIGTKMNMLHLWALATAPSFGRGIALELNLHDLRYKAERIRDTFGVVRRLYKGLWDSGPILASMRGSEGPVLDRSWLDRFAADRIPLDEDLTRATFQRFNGAAELMGFLLHFDNRLGVGDHGPYRLEDGGFVIARDIFLNEPAFPWCDSNSELPYALTVAMFFDADSGLEVEMMDISTVFTKPANYLPQVTGVAVYERTEWDTPVEEVRTLSLNEMEDLRTRCEQQSASLYARIAGMSKREKVEAGAMVYTAGFALPVARAAGMYDELCTGYGFLEIHPAVRACYDTIVSGVATEMIPRLFLTGSWGNPVPEQVGDRLAEDSDEFPVLHTLRVRGFADTAKIVESTVLQSERVDQALAKCVERGHVKQREGRISGAMLTPSGKARHVLLLGDTVPPEAQRSVRSLYESFLAPNRNFKQLTTDWQMSDGDDHAVTVRLSEVHAQVADILAKLTEVQPRFERYLPRFADALNAFRAGDTDALAKPLSGSYHDVWMELHEDLLATLGEERTDGDG